MRKLSAAYFYGELLIPEVSGSTYAEVKNLESLNLMIKRHEVKFLRQMLGADFYEAYAAGISTNPTTGKWFDLNHQIYEEDTATPATYESPAAGFVYFKFWQIHSTLTTGTGEAQAKIQNADLVSIGYKMVRAWNTMSDRVEEIKDWLDAHALDYPTWDRYKAESFDKVNICGC